MTAKSTAPVQGDDNDEANRHPGNDHRSNDPVGLHGGAGGEGAEIKDRLYVVTPDAVSVKSGILLGELTEMKVTERVEDGSGRIATPARLTGKLVLKNVSSDQSVRLLAGKVLYMDKLGKPIVLEDKRTEPTIKIGSGYSAQERLDPGQNMAQNVEAEFPAAALEASRLKDIRLELSYIPRPSGKKLSTSPCRSNHEHLPLDARRAAIGWIGYAFLDFNEGRGQLVSIVIGVVGGLLGGKVARADVHRGDGCPGRRERSGAGFRRRNRRRSAGRRQLHREPLGRLIPTGGPPIPVRLRNADEDSGIKAPAG